jgi:hypothetical protein
MDAVDRQILAELQQDGRVTLTELAERVGLSLSPCHRRLRALEHSGAISGYHAHLDPNALGLTFEALVLVPCAPLTGPRSTRSKKPSPQCRTSDRPNGSSVTPTTCYASSPPICPPSSSSTTPPGHPPRRTTPQLHPGHEEGRRKPSPPTLRQDPSDRPTTALVPVQLTAGNSPDLSVRPKLVRSFAIFGIDRLVGRPAG